MKTVILAICWILVAPNSFGQLSKDASEARFLMLQNKPDAALEKVYKLLQKDSKKEKRAIWIRELGDLQSLALNSGNESFGRKEFDYAIAYYRISEEIANAFSQSDTNAVFNSALAYESKGEHENAIKRYREAIELGYNKPEVYRYISSLQRKNEHIDAAIETTREGRQRFPDNKDLLLDEMSYLLAADRTAEAEETVKLAIKQDPNNAVLYSVQGSLFDGKANPKEGPAPAEEEMLKWFQEAERAYKKSIELDPTFFDAYFNVGVLYNNRAAFEYEKCKAIKADAEYMKCQRKADYTYILALPYFERAHLLKPQDSQTNGQLLKLYAKVNDLEKYQQLKKYVDGSSSYSGVNASNIKQPELSFANSSSDHEVLLTKDGGVFTLSIEVNGILLHGVVYDTGASGICISSTEYYFLRKQGLLSDEDILGTAVSTLADGSSMDNLMVNLRQVKIGSAILSDVAAIVVGNQNAPILLGQTALERFSRVALDNKRSVLILSP